MKIKSRKTIPFCLAVLFVFALAFILSKFFLSGKLESITEGAAEALSTGYIKEENTVEMPSGTSAVKSIGIKGSSLLRIAAGGDYRLTYAVKPEDANESVYWMSSNERCVTVNSEGLIKTVGVGEAVISVSPSSNACIGNIVVTVTEPPASILDVPYIWQVTDYPNGCESCSTVMALNYMGIDIDTDEFIDKYLDMCSPPAVDENGVYSGYSPWTHFAGDPRDSSGLCCYAPVIANALEKFVDTDKYKIDEMHGVPIETLCTEYVSRGIPVVFWATMYMQAPYYMDWTWSVTDGKEGETFTWVAPMHCMLLVGFDDDCYYFNDPVAGKKVAYTKEDTQKAYEGLYEQALAVYPITEE